MRPIVLPAVAGLLLLAACSGPAEQGSEPRGQTPSDHQTSPQEEGPSESPTAEPPGQDEEFTIVSAGDVLIHDAVFEAAEQPGGGYDFEPGMAAVQEWISGADLALCSMEVPLAAEGEEPTGYPLFGAPGELVPGLAATGFHGCNTANNHSLDSGVDGLRNTLETFDAHGLGHVGTARSQEEAQTPQLYTLQRADREITVAHLSTTMLHNDVAPPPADAPWMVTDLTAEDLTALAAQARQDGADIVVASVHWGTEYVHEPTEEQRAYGEDLAAGGEIDVVYGNHSHTPQPIEQLDGGPEEHGMWVVWSMGNFLANQDEECCLMETATGTMVYATVDVPAEDPARVTEVEWSPVTVDREGERRGDEVHRGIWPLAELVNDGIPAEAELEQATVDQRWERVIEVMGEDQLRTEPPQPSGEAPDVLPRSVD